MSVAGIDLPRKRAGCAGDARHGRVEFRRSALCYLGIGGFSVYIPGGNAALCIVCRSYCDAAHADICRPVGAVSLILEGIADRRGRSVALTAFSVNITSLYFVLSITFIEAVSSLELNVPPEIDVTFNVPPAITATPSL